MKKPATYLQRHAYAPELNTLYWRGYPFRAPGCVDISSARRKVFPRLTGVTAATIETIYDAPEHRGLNRIRAQGRFTSRLEVVRLARRLRAENPGGVLFDGSTLPPAKTRVKIYHL